MPVQELKILGGYGAKVSIRFARIVHDHGDGYVTKALVGNSAGERLFALNYDFLPNEGSLTVVDTENGNAVTNWPAYLWRFYVRRMVDGAAFNIIYEDPDAGASTTTLVDFVDNQLDYDWMTFKLYSSGVLLRQART